MYKLMFTANGQTHYSVNEFDEQRAEVLKSWFLSLGGGIQCEVVPADMGRVS